MKGKLAQIFSYARFKDQIEHYTIGYRDFEETREIALSDYLNRLKTNEPIPESRIKYVKRSSTIIYEKRINAGYKDQCPNFKTCGNLKGSNSELCEDCRIWERRHAPKRKGN